MTDACLLDMTCLKQPTPGDVLSPWVMIQFNKAGRIITVGNESYPTEQTACIRDFEFGHENGFVARVTIHDEQGGGFSKFMEDLIKDLNCANGDNQNMDVQFGWTGSSCNDNGLTDQYLDASPLYKMMVRDVTCSFAGGKFMYEISGVDLTEMVFESRTTKTYGGDGNNEIYLTDAIDQMMKDTEFPPAIKSVRWLQTSGSGKCNSTVNELTFNHSDGGDIHPKKGPKGKWECKNQNKIEAALEWLSEFSTINDKGIVPYYNCEENAEVIFWEDNRPNCNDKGRDWDNTKHGTYLVNGGNDSSVIEFNPRIKWTWANLTNPGGNTGAGEPYGTENDGKQPGLPECETINGENLPSAGSTTSGAASENAVNTYGKNANKKIMINQARQQKALNVFHLPIEADLVVLGEPRCIRPSTGINKNIHIIVVNPYHITGGKTNSGTNVVECGEWLALPDVCNVVLSNKAWMIRNITHRITEGKFTTTFGVYLGTPGVDIDVGEPFGGVGSGGWTPPPNCEG